MTAVLTRFATDRDADAVESVLTRHMEGRLGAAAAYGEDYTSLWRAIARSTRGGKLLRPALVLGVHDQLGGSRADAAVQAAAAFELLHTAFLLHDDVIDNDLVRRGRRNLAGERVDEGVAAGIGSDNAERWAHASAILAGDLLIHDAQSLLARLGVPGPMRLQLLDILDEAVFASAAGELADVAFSTGAVRPELRAVLDMTADKTAPYSFSAPLRAGAVLAGAAEHTGAVLAQFGALVGLAFQLRDDVLGAFGDEAVTGKSSLGDAREGKLTAMMAYAGRTPAWPELRGLLGRVGAGDGDGAAEMARVRELLVSCGALDFVEEAIRQSVAESVRLLEGAGLPDGLRTELAQLSRLAAERAA